MSKLCNKCSRILEEKLEKCFGSSEEYPGKSTDDLLSEFIQSLLKKEK